MKYLPSFFLSTLFIFTTFSFAQDPITQGNIQGAVDLWVSNPSEAEATYGHISDWDVSSVTNMSNLFENKTTFNDDIGNWDVSNVTNMKNMFIFADNFNQSLTNWDVSSVTTMEGMFYSADSFNGDVSGWDVSNAINMQQLFDYTPFNNDISGWDVSSVTNMASMFAHCHNFSSDISGWDVSSLTNMDGMFREATSFNQDILNWNVASVTNMWNVFYDATSFNQDISGWDVSSATSMSNMFRNAESFNQNISGWDVLNVTNMSNMFLDTDALSDDNKCAIHTAFSSNNAWPYDWSALCPPQDPNLIAVGARNEVLLMWDAIELALSYNIYRDGFLVGSTSSTNYTDPESGFGLDYMTEYCYTVTSIDGFGVEGPHSYEACATTLPYVLVGLGVDVDPLNGLIYVSMANLWYISGYQFDVSIDGDFEIVAAVDGQLDIQYANGTVIGFSMTGEVIPPNPEGTILAALAFNPTDVDFSGNYGVSLSNFVFADESAMPLNVCDMDFNPLNGCDVSTSFDFSIDCAGEWFGSAVEDCNGDCGGDAVVDDCDVCDGGNADQDCAGVCFGSSVDTWCDGFCGETGPVEDCNGDCGGDAEVETYCLDTDADGQGNPGTDTDFCNATVEDGWVVDCSDDTPWGEASLSYGTVDGGSFEVEDGTIEVLYNSTVDVYGFQFNVSGVTLTGASSEHFDNVSLSPSTGNIIGFSFTGAVAPAGSGILVTLSFEPNSDVSEACMYDEILSAEDGFQIASSNAGCTEVQAGILSAPTGLMSTGGRNEIDISWDAVPNATSYNIYRDGSLVGSTASTNFTDPESGFGLEYSTEYCYTITTINVSGLESMQSTETCATTLPYVLVGIGGEVDTDVGLIGVYAFNFWDISGFQLDISIDGPFEILGVIPMEGMLDQVQYANGTLIGFSMTGDVIEPNPEGNVLAILQFTNTDVDFEGSFNVNMSNFIFADEEAMPLNACDLDFDPTNGCDVALPFDFSVDCAGDWFGDAIVDECGVCEGNNSSCTGCMDEEAYNYDPDAIFDGENCIYGTPEINYIVDIPDDQGRNVYISFNASGLDTDTLSRDIEMYTVERWDADPMNEIDSSWVAVMSGSAYGEANYLYQVSTLIDSNDTDYGMTNFRVIANMDEGIWASDPAWGYSVDNLSPASPGSLVASYQDADQVILSWDMVMDEDLSHYAVYRSEDGIFTNPYAEVFDIEFVDTGEIDVGVYYVISAFDHNGNESGFSNEVYVETYAFTQDIIIEALKFNTLSLNVIPEYLAISDVLGDAGIMLAKNDVGEFYAPEFGVDQIGDMDLSEGYKIFINGMTDQSIFVTGPPVDASQLLLIEAFKMNLLPYLPQIEMASVDAFGIHDDNILLIKNDSGDFYVPSFGVYSLDMLYPGESYSIFLSGTSNIDFIYPEPGLSRVDEDMRAYYNSCIAEHYTPVKTGLSYPVIITDVNGYINIGDELAAYANDELVGAVKIMDMSKPAVITTWQGYHDHNIDLPGFDIGDEIELRLWSVADNQEKRVEVVLNDPYYGSSPLSYGSAVVYNMDPSPSEFFLAPAYPNPFNPVTNIKYGLPNDGFVSVHVYDISGKVVAELVSDVRAAGYHTITWDANNQSSGLYFVKFTTQEFTRTQKLMLLK